MQLAIWIITEWNLPKIVIILDKRQQWHHSSIAMGYVVKLVAVDRFRAGHIKVPLLNLTLALVLRWYQWVFLAQVTFGAKRPLFNQEVASRPDLLGFDTYLTALRLIYSYLTRGSHHRLHHERFQLIRLRTQVVDTRLLDPEQRRVFILILSLEEFHRRWFVLLPTGTLVFYQPLQCALP